LTNKSLPRESLEAHKRLQGEASPEVIRAVLSLRELRLTAGSKFRDPSSTLLLPKGLEQATDGRVARWRAAELSRLAPGRPTWDCTSGLGSDALACAEHNIEVLLSDADPAVAAIAAHNLAQATGHPAPAFAGDATQPPLRVAGDWLLLFDPDRRATATATDRGRPGGGRRRLDPSDFAPPIETWPALLARFSGAAVKLPPALDPTDLETTGPLAAFLTQTPHRWVWTEAGGSLRELTLFTGILAPKIEPHRAAVRLFGPGLPPVGEAPAQATLSAEPPPAGGKATPFQVRTPLPAPEAITLIAEPRPSARRAGLAAAACRALDPSFGPIDEGEAYFATTEPAPDACSTNFVNLFRVLGSAPLDKKKVRRLCREHGIGPLTIKKRGLPESSATLERQFATKNGTPGLAIACPTKSGRRFFLLRTEPGSKVNTLASRPPSS